MRIREAKKRKKKYDSMYFTTGDPKYEADFFNKHAGTYLPGSVNAESCSQADTILAQSPDGASSVECSASSEGSMSAGGESSGGEGMSENMKINEAKRYVRRYYARPMNKFASNKDEVIRILLDADKAGKNCSIYTLNNLVDNDDVTKLTPKDIIYYYDDGVLYDKNHVKVMDYELKIKHEEKRDVIDPDKVSDNTFEDTYDDRITDKTGKDIDVLTESVDIQKLAYNRAADMANKNGKPVIYGIFKDGKFKEVAPVICGKNPADDADKVKAANADITVYTAYPGSDLVDESVKINESQSQEIGDSYRYLSKAYGIDLEDLVYGPEGFMANRYPDGFPDFCGDIIFTEKYWDEFEDWLREKYGIDLAAKRRELAKKDPQHWRADPISEGKKIKIDAKLKKYFDLEEKLNEGKDEICCICGEPIEGYGNNPEPYKHEGRCCDACNLKFVIPARLAQINENED